MYRRFVAGREEVHRPRPGLRLRTYAARKKANEAKARTYAHLYGRPTTGLRFFTVCGPWGRPDMALFLFTKAILEGRPIDVFNQGDMRRDFPYIDDIAESVVRVSDQPAAPNPTWDDAHPDPMTSRAPWRVFNIGNHTPVESMHVIELIETALGRKAEKNLLPMQPGNVPTPTATCRRSRQSGTAWYARTEHPSPRRPRAPRYVAAVLLAGFLAGELIVPDTFRFELARTVSADALDATFDAATFH